MRFKRIAKVAWYLGGGILILSLPTFSYLIPKTELVLGPPTLRETDHGAASHPDSSRPGLSSPDRAPTSFFVSPSPLRAAPTPPLRSRSARPDGSLLKDVQADSQPVPRAVMAIPMRTTVSPPLSEVRRDSRRDPQSLNPAWSGRHGSDLNSLDQKYQAAMGELFRDFPLGLGGYGGNPFNDALPHDGKPTDDSGKPNGDDGGNDGGDNNNNGNNNGNDSEVHPPPTPPPDDHPKAKRYSFLLIGDFGGGQSKSKVFRGYREPDGSFVSDDGARINPLPATLGGGRLLTPPENMHLVSADIEGDGNLDLLVSQVVAQGTVLELYLGNASGTYGPPSAGAFFIWQAISSVGLFDFDSDGKLDLAVLFPNSSNLFVYTIDGQDFKYLKEIVLPFEPSVVVDSLIEGFPGERRLYVFDASLYRLATLSSRNPGVFLLGLATLQSFKSYRLDAEEDGPGEADILVFENSGGIALAEKRGGSIVVLGSFSTIERYPIIVFGDYQNTGSRQLLCLP